MDRRLRNRIVFFLLGAGLVAFVLVKLSGRQPVAKISAVTPVRENLVSSISSNGKVEPIAPFVIRAQLNTFIEQVDAMEGQKVKKGQLLLQLDVKDAAAQLAQARQKLLNAQNDLGIAKSGGRPDDVAKVNSDLSNAKATRDRLQHDQAAFAKLLQEQAATKDEVAANQLALTKAQAEVDRLEAVKEQFDRNVGLDAQRSALQVQQAQSEVASLEEKVADGRITAPSDGTLYSLPVKRGDFVKVGDLLAEMADLHKVRVRAFIDEPDLGSLEPDEPVRITWDALPNQSWQGVTEVIPKQVVQRGMRSVGELLCSVDNNKLELLPNINVNVRINSRERRNVLTIPRGAVEADGTKRYVFVVKDGNLGVGKSTLEKREIRVGIADATSYEVVSGLGESDVVALPGDVDLRDGMAVQIVNMAASNLPGEGNAR
jgi:HlyD family secretion protein